MTLTQKVQFAGSLVKPLGDCRPDQRRLWHPRSLAGPPRRDRSRNHLLRSAGPGHRRAAARGVSATAPRSQGALQPKAFRLDPDSVRRCAHRARADTALSSADGVTRTKFSLPILITTDGERHAQMRRQILPAFTKAALDSWRPMIDRLAVELVGDVLDNPGCDAVQRLAVPMPMRLIAHMLGVPDTDVDEFRRWSEAAVQVTDLALTRRGVSKLAASVSGSRSIYRYFYRQFAVGGLKGSDTILGRLLAKNEDGTITEDELFYFANAPAARRQRDDHQPSRRHVRHPRAKSRLLQPAPR